MTREEILALPAGKALDKQIAEKIMGLAPCGPPMVDWMCWTLEGYTVSVPDFSSDLGDAWLVLDLLDQQGWSWTIWGVTPVSSAQRGPRVAFRRGILPPERGDPHAVVVEAETVPLAICRAALLVHLASQEVET